jgi:hypothetical protein
MFETDLMVQRFLVSSFHCKRAPSVSRIGTISQHVAREWNNVANKKMYAEQRCGVSVRRFHPGLRPPKPMAREGDDTETGAGGGAVWGRADC